MACFADRLEQKERSDKILKTQVQNNLRYNRTSNRSVHEFQLLYMHSIMHVSHAYNGKNYTEIQRVSQV